MDKATKIFSHRQGEGNSASDDDLPDDLDFGEELEMFAGRTKVLVSKFLSSSRQIRPSAPSSPLDTSVSDLNFYSGLKSPANFVSSGPYAFSEARTETVFPPANATTSQWPGARPDDPLTAPYPDSSLQIPGDVNFDQSAFLTDSSTGLMMGPLVFGNDNLAAMDVDFTESDAQSGLNAQWLLFMRDSGFLDHSE